MYPRINDGHYTIGILLSKTRIKNQGHLYRVIETSRKVSPGLGDLGIKNKEKFS
jgi:hypothetical protein